MKRIFERSILGAFVAAASAAPLYARPHWWGGGHGGGVSVPEIDASSGVLAVAAVVAVVAFVAERRRRAA